MTNVWRSKREAIDALDAIRSETDWRIRQRRHDIENFMWQLKEDYEFVRHSLGHARHCLRGAYMVQVPREWAKPKFQFGDRVSVETGSVAGWVTGMEYSDGSVFEPGWHYTVALEEFTIPFGDLYSWHEAELNLLGSVSVLSELGNEPGNGSGNELGNELETSELTELTEP